jgi:hypothetical protein
MKDELRAPPWSLVLRWGRQLRLEPTEIADVSQRLVLRHKLGKIETLYAYSRENLG